MLFDTRVPQDMAKQPQDLFFVSADFTGSKELAAAPAAGASQIVTISVDQDAHLLLVGAAHFTTNSAETTQGGGFILVTLKVSSSGREMMSSAQHLQNIAGTAQLPCVWPRPKFIAAGSSLTVTAQNLEGTARRCRLTFYAFKIFKA